MRVYLLLALVAAAGTYLATPLARRFAVRVGAITALRARDVHVVPIPRLGGLAMLAGMALAFVLASRMPFLAGVFESGAMWGILGAAAAVSLLGAADDVWELDWVTKLIGQVLAAGLLAWWGRVQLYALPTGTSLTITSGRTSLLLTVLAVIVAINAVNFVDGLDGLAAGVVAIGGAGFFLYSYLLTRNISVDYANAASVVVAVLVGACIGFLPHNAHPARIFMGDSGSMLIGLTFSASAILVTGQVDAATLTARQQAPAFVPLVLPVAVLLLPLLDMGLAVVRRLKAGTSPFRPDRLHLHHRMLQIGHSHRRAVAILYLWTALFAFGGASLMVWTTTQALIAFGVAAGIALALTLGPLRGRSTPRHEPHTVPDGETAAGPDPTPAGTQGD
ncbi:MraY family glycosyltransferase [Actinotalea sp.]|uniref:MraY family glycosyltransferase n=1 Tax=Actinotalea sp. TaxID=1872145 RepID=UPI003566AC0C